MHFLALPVVLFSLLHLLSQTHRPHVGPDFFDIGQAFRLRTGFSNFSPAQWRLTIGKPDRVLFLMIHDDFIVCCIFFLFHCSNSPFIPSWFPCSKRSRCVSSSDNDSNFANVLENSSPSNSTAFCPAIAVANSPRVGFS